MATTPEFISETPPSFAFEVPAHTNSDIPVSIAEDPPQATSKPSDSANPKPELENKPSDGKTIICCFDGTGNKFGENSNVVRLLDALIKDKPDEQVIYYQPGIGTYSENQYYTTTISQLVSKLDECLALFLDDHVKEGYKFIMQHYKPKDRICLFGFSRGAYIARVLMGMIYKIGLLPPDNIQQVDFAFSVYKMTGDKGRELSREFKKTFALNVTIEFVGVWDTVASVGITPTPVSRHPYTSVDYATKVFRHALALDECRVRFQPQTWNTATTDREQELDVDEPKFPDGDENNPYDYVPPDRVVADVKEEVWFAGCHADIGGGSHHGRLQNSLSYIPFRWMISKADEAGCGILFDWGHLSFNYINDARKRPDFVRKYKDKSQGKNQSVITFPDGTRIGRKEEKRLGDLTAPIYDQLSSAKLWWLLEYIPLLSTYQTVSGSWIKERRRNLGEGRRIPFHSDKRKVLVHRSVDFRMKLDKGYKPKALNWDLLDAGNLIQWVGEAKYKSWTFGTADLKVSDSKKDNAKSTKKVEGGGGKSKVEKTPVDWPSREYTDKRGGQQAGEKGTGWQEGEQHERKAKETSEGNDRQARRGRFGRRREEESNETEDEDPEDDEEDDNSSGGGSDDDSDDYDSDGEDEEHEEEEEEEEEESEEEEIFRPPPRSRRR